MALEVGIVGLPGAGKTTLFTALTKTGGAGFGKENVGMASIADERLEQLAALVGARKVTPATIRRGPTDGSPSVRQGSTTIQPRRCSSAARTASGRSRAARSAAASLGGTGVIVGGAGADPAAGASASSAGSWPAASSGPCACSFTAPAKCPGATSATGFRNSTAMNSSSS